MKSYYTIYLWQEKWHQPGRSKKYEMAWVPFCDVDTLEEAYKVVKDDPAYKIVHLTEELIDVKEAQQ